MHPRIVDITTPLRCLCSDGEFELERYWAEKVLQKESQGEGELSPVYISLFRC